MSNKLIVALGYSEGGIDSIKTFFDNIPHDQVSYIILRHIPINSRSELHEILKRHSKLTILEAENDSEIKNDVIYIPPASKYLIIKNDKLFLEPRVHHLQTYNRLIDIFLESLAKDKGKNSIAIIFSGMGNDGAKGVSQIKEAGGMVIVQKPETCDYADMPKNAIATGCVDNILLSSEMPHIVTKHANSILKNENERDRYRKIRH